ncbi:MAG: NAD(+) diphosphatase [Pseudomonadota bacterium]
MVQITFGASGLERAAHLRPEHVAPGGPRQNVLPIWRGKVAVRDDATTIRPLWLAPEHAVFDDAAEPAIFLGLDDGAPCYVRDISFWEASESDPQIGGLFDPSVQVHPALPEKTGLRELRSIMTTIDPRAAELLATAKALTGWHATHRFCAVCGQPSEMAEAGWQRRCDACGARHFPRTDPVVIVLVTHGNDLLLGRSPGWPEGMYSLLAGFVEPGETLEAAAAREVFEESGVRLANVRYAACQPWPFPASLMMGMVAEAKTREITLDPVELEDAVWLSREEVMATLTGSHPSVRAARRGAIARSMIEEWLAGRIS